MSDNQIIIFDLDGTLALNKHREHFILGPNKDWDAFFLACGNDAPNIPIIEINRALFERYIIWIYSGRGEIARAMTEAWLRQHGVVYNYLRMRAIDDHTPDEVLKREWLAEDCPDAVGAERVAMVFDDRDKVVKMWRDEGLTCLQVAPGDF